MKKLFLAAITSLVLFSCSKDRLPYDEPSSTKIVGFSSTVKNAAYFTNVGAVDFKLPVKLYGLADGQLSTTPITMTYSVDTANSTATEGVEFSITGASRQITIQPGSTFASIPMVVNTGSLNALHKTEVFINITTTSEGVIGEQFKTIKVVFVGCATSLEGNYNTYMGTSFTGPATVTKIAPNVYRCSRLPGIQSSGQPLTFDFSDVCGDLEIVEWEIESGYPMFQTGTTSDRPTGVILSPSGNLFFTKVNLKGLSFYTDKSFTLVRI